MKQLIILADMEGASGIFEGNREAIYHGASLWREEGRAFLTSDVLAVCEAANACGVDDILLYDGHFAGCPEYNVILEKLPHNVRVFDVPERRFFWRRIRGQAALAPFGVITAGQHARYGEPDGFFAHTIQSPPIAAFWANGLHIAEIGMGVLNFSDTPYLANIGCQASMKEARELSSNVRCIPVKDKKTGWMPSPEETFPQIVEGVREAIENHENMRTPSLIPPYAFALEILPGYFFSAPDEFPWKGTFSHHLATWEAPSLEMGLELFSEVRACIQKEDSV